MSSEPRIDTKEAIINAAIVTIERDGFNALSFRDLATDCGIKSASVHYHFPTKGDLAETLVSRYGTGFLALMGPPEDKTFEQAMGDYIALFRRGFNGTNRTCLAGMFSAEVSALTPAAQEGLETFAETHKEFLRVVLKKKYKRMADDKLRSRAIGIYAALEGAQLITKGFGGDPAVFDEIIELYKQAGLLD